MKGTLSKLIIFAAGAAIGSAVSWKILKTKYEQLAQEEIAEMREYVREKIAEMTETHSGEKCIGVTTEPEKEPETYNNISDINEYTSKLRENGYTDYSGVSSTDTKKGGNVAVDAPYVISPDEFGELDYEMISLTYYANGVLTDDYDEPMDDGEIDETVGHESLCHFGEYEDDSVFVRNEMLKRDYEILRDLRDYIG